MNGQQVGIVIIGCVIGVTLIVLGLSHPWCDGVFDGTCVVTSGGVFRGGGLSPKVPLWIGVGVIAATVLLAFLARGKSSSDDQPYKPPWG